jgi:ribonucleoside-diphosphate reductase beta chain
VEAKAEDRTAHARTAEEEAEVRTAETLSEIAHREGFLETSDPALQESAERGQAKLLGYRDLYLLWERQQWATQDLDFSRDRIDWHERIPPEERFQRMYGLSGFFIGEQRVTDELGPIMRACPLEEQRIFLSTQIADEARHVRFFDRFYSEVDVYDGTDGLAERLRATEEHLNEAFGELFDGLLHTKVDRLAAEPEDTEALVEAITLYHMIIEGALALTGQHFIIEYNEDQDTLPAFVEGFQNVARDEHRHIAFGVRFLLDMAESDGRYREAMQRTMAEALPVADRVLDPPWAEEDDWEMFGYSRAETHSFAAQSLSRRLKGIGLA